MAKFPQLDWVAINGRDTPFTKPQHYKEGSTSETDLTGHDNPLPTTDKSVRAELESIKATQAKILERLDEPLDTQLTGSNVEDEKAIPVRTTGRMVIVGSMEDVYVEGGSAVYFKHINKNPVKNYDKIVLLMRWDSSAPKTYDIVIGYYGSGTTSRGVTTEDKFDNNILGEDIKLKSPFYTGYIYNRSENSHLLRTLILTGG